jgi:hypothetical protein
VAYLQGTLSGRALHVCTLPPPLKKERINLTFFVLLPQVSVFANACLPQGRLCLPPLPMPACHEDAFACPNTFNCWLLTTKKEKVQ